MIEGFVLFFNDTATTEIYTLSLHDALPISHSAASFSATDMVSAPDEPWTGSDIALSSRTVGPAPMVLLSDRKSTRLNSSHANISYAVFCLKKKTELHYAPAHRTICSPVPSV